ncbi:MAG: ATP-binding protein, partial [Bacteroidota bacterium]
PQKEIFFQADPELLEQVLINLIKNAIDACREQPNPTVNLNLLRTKDNRTLIQVVDNGSGIEPEVLDQIFIPFYTTKREGSGIGLSLSRQIIGMHKGTLGVQTALGEGTVFTISL